jgi:hypothetical protein
LVPTVQNLLSSRLLFKILKIINMQAIILPVVLYGCESSCITLRGEHRLRVFDNRVLGRIFGPKREEVAGSWKDCIMSSITCPLH